MNARLLRSARTMVVLVVLVPASLTAADGERGAGYMTIPPSSPGPLLLQPPSIFLPLAPVPEGGLDASVGMQWANVYCYDPDRYLIDGEIVRAEMRIAYGLSETLSVGVGVPCLGWTGGFADSSIERFHETFGLGNGDRDLNPRNQSAIWFRTGDTTRTIVQDDVWGVGDIAVFGVLRAPYLWAEPSLIMRLTLPTGDDQKLQGMGAPSVGLAAAAAQRLGNSPVRAYFGAGVSYCPKESLGGVALNKTTCSGLLGLDYRFGDRLSFVAQLLSTSGVAKNFGELSDPSYELGVGFRWKAGRAMVIHLALVENLFTYHNSSDISLCVGFGQTLR